VSPLPVATLTRPALIVKPHQASHRAGSLGNAEEVSAPAGAEPSLVAFTLLAQLAVGATWFQTVGMAWLQAVGATSFRSVSESLNVPALLLITVIMLVALMASFLHLGQPFRAWRAIANLRTSWLSREVLFATLFAGALVGALAAGGRGTWIASAIGLALIISMAQVYRLRTVPEWNARATTASFFATTLLLGAVWHGALIAATPGWALGVTGLIALRLQIGRREPPIVRQWCGAAIVALLLTVITPAGWWGALALVATAEVLARRQFYATRAPRSAWRFAAPSL
jgi:DMSO reductase anchor subunit